MTAKIPTTIAPTRSVGMYRRRKFKFYGGVLGLMAIRHSIVVYPSVENCAVIQPLGYCGLPDGCHAAIYINSDMITADVPNTAIREPVPWTVG